MPVLVNIIYIYINNIYIYILCLNIIRMDVRLIEKLSMRFQSSEL